MSKNLDFASKLWSTADNYYRFVEDFEYSWGALSVENEFINDETVVEDWEYLLTDAVEAERNALKAAAQLEKMVDQLTTAR